YAGSVASVALPPAIPPTAFNQDQERNDLAAKTKQIEDRRKIRDSQYDVEIANLEQQGKDDQAIANLKKERAEKDRADDEAIGQLHTDAANRAKAAGAPSAVVQTFQEGATGAQVQANQAQAQATNAQTAANQQAYQQQ